MKTITEERVREILAKTDWKAYWKKVANGVKHDVAAYDEARRKSLTRAHEKVLR